MSYDRLQVKFYASMPCIDSFGENLVLGATPDDYYILMVAARLCQGSAVPSLLMTSEKNSDVKDRAIIAEFTHLLEKSKQLFYGLRQRTSDLHYLSESFAFFYAIRSRDYYSKACKEERPDLMVKKLRYYTRFILVCILLRKIKLANELLREFITQVDEYTTVFNPQDHLDWNLVIQEIRDFIEGDSLCIIGNNDQYPTVLTHRLSSLTSPHLEKFGTSQLQLTEVVIVGNCYDQIRFSELSLDMYRMLQTFECESDSSLLGSIRNNKFGPDVYSNGLTTPYSSEELNGYLRSHNPHKYLLYKPTFSHFVTSLTASFNDVTSNGIMLLYLSADGVKSQSTKYDEPRTTGQTAYESGGVVTNSRRDLDFNVKPKKVAYKETHCIHPGDLIPYTRKPFFLIVDSDNSTAFKNLPCLFGQPIVCLMSPEVIPDRLEIQRQNGNLFTLFLHCPLTAFCHVCHVKTTSLKTWVRARDLLNSFLIEAYRLLTRSRNLDYSYMQFIVDDFLRLIVLRYCFCKLVLSLHRDFKGSGYYPSCSPALPDSELVDSHLLSKIIIDLASLFDASSMFASPDDYSR